MRRLVCACVVHKPLKTGFLATKSNHIICTMRKSKRVVGGEGLGTPMENHKPIDFRSNTDPDRKENYIYTQPAFNVESSLTSNETTF